MSVEAALTHPGWRLRRVADVCQIVNGHPFDSETFSSDGEVPLVRIRDLTADQFETFVPELTVPRRVLLEDGDLVVGMDGDFEAVHWRRGPAALNQRLCYLRAKPGVDLRFVGYALPAHLKVINDLTYATTVKHLSSGQISAIRFPMPGFENQRRIAEFLDRETAQIDELIAKQEQLISTLAERRASIVEELALGRRLPSRAWRRPGERWMRKLPTAWPVVPSHRLFAQRLGRALPDDEQLTSSQRHGIVRQADFAEREYSVMQVIKDPTILKHVEPGDFVISMRSFQGGLEFSELRGCISSAYVMLVPGSDIEPSFFRHLFKSTSYVQGLQSTSNLVRDGQALRFENFKKLALPLPPKETQRALAREIDEAHARIDSLSARVGKAIELLRERRQALISAAVTGQIDVGRAS